MYKCYELKIGTYLKIGAIELKISVDRLITTTSHIIRDSSDSNPRFYDLTPTLNHKSGVRVRGVSDYFPHIYNFQDVITGAKFRKIND